MTPTKTPLVGLSREELIAALASVGMEKFRAKQIWQWLYVKGVHDFAAMTNISKKHHAMLDEHFTLARTKIDKDLISTDGTRKWLLEFADGNKAEMVYIPEDDRGTLCISSQVGCTLTCKFCHTGTQTLVRNLTPEEIVQQILIARDGLGEWNKEDDGRIVTNIVLMGMGEPLYNYDNVAKAIAILMDHEGISLSRRRITLSTSGVVPEMERLGREIAVNLAVSLHAVNDEVRSKIMPINKKYPLEQLLDACRNYDSASNSRRITFEYVMLKDINDSEEDARELVRLLKGIPSKVNLIPFNHWEGAEYECSPMERIKRFSDIVFQSGISAPIRRTRGEDIYAACGQLKSASERMRKSKRACAESA